MKILLIILLLICSGCGGKYWDGKDQPDIKNTTIVEKVKDKDGKTIWILKEK